MPLQRRRSLAVIPGFVVVVAAGLLAQTSPPADDANSARFEVASLKQNVSGNFQTSPPLLPNGETRLVNRSARNLILLAYPLETVPPDVLNAPSWLESERYDVIAKGKAAPTAEERQQMWRALLTDRMKLAAHYETREKPTYDLVTARSDRTLGAGLKPSTLDCTKPEPQLVRPPTADIRGFALSRCRSFWFDRDGTMSTGGTDMTTLIRQISPTAGRTVFDRTGLTGFFAVTLRYQRLPPRADTPPGADDPPLLSTALQEQLGLKLESVKAQVPVLVIDHVERPEPD